MKASSEKSSDDRLL